MDGDQRINNEAFIIIIIIISRRGISVGTVTRQGRQRNRRTISRRRKLFLPPRGLPFSGGGWWDYYTREGQSDRSVNLTNHLPLSARLKNEWRYSFIAPLYLFGFMYRIVTTRNYDYFVHPFFLYFGKLDVDGRILVKWTVKLQDINMWIGISYV